MKILNSTQIDYIVGAGSNVTGGGGINVMKFEHIGKQITSAHGEFGYKHDNGVNVNFSIDKVKGPDHNSTRNHAISISKDFSSGNMSGRVEMNFGSSHSNTNGFSNSSHSWGVSGSFNYRLP